MSDCPCMDKARNPDYWRTCPYATPPYRPTGLDQVGKTLRDLQASPYGGSPALALLEEKLREIARDRDAMQARKAGGFEPRRGRSPGRKASPSLSSISTDTGGTEQ